MRLPDMPLLQLRPIWARVAGVSLLTNLLMLVPTLYMLQIFDRILPGQHEWSLLFLSLITLYLYGILAGTEWLRARMLINAALSFDQQASAAVYKKKMGMHSADPGGWQPLWMSRLSEVRQLLSGPALLTAIDLCMTPIFILALYILHPWLAAFAVAMMAMQFLLARLSHANSRTLNVQARHAWQDENQRLLNALRHFQSALALGMQSALHGRWRTSHAQALQASHNQQSAQARAASFIKFVRYAQQGLGLALGAWLVIRGELSPGAMIAANVLVTRSLSPIDQWTSSWSQIQQASESYKALSELITQHTLHQDRPAASRQPVEKAQWIFQRVLLLVEGRTQPVISHLSMTLEPGQITALHGPSGAGKSSLLKAMTGQWPMQHLKGDIRWGTQRIGHQHWAHDGNSIGYLSQDVELFTASVSENIARMSTADPQAVVEAARLVGIHEQILALPQGYDTRLGEQFMLSRGLRQRIGLARAIYTKPAWLLLDEPSAHLDQAATTQLMQMLRTLQTQGISVLMTTHHRPLIQMADRRLHLEAGVLVSS